MRPINFNLPDRLWPCLLLVGSFAALPTAATAATPG